MKKDKQYFEKINKEKKLYRDFLVLRENYIHTKSIEEEKNMVDEITKMFKLLDVLQVELGIVPENTSKQRLQNIIDLCKEEKEKYIKFRNEN